MDSLDLARVAFQKYGAVRTRLRQAPHGSITAHTYVSLRAAGRINVTDLVLPVLDVLPCPDNITVTTMRCKTRIRPVIDLEWRGQEKTRLIITVLGPLGKPSWDAKATALLRWHAYQRASLGHDQT